MEIPRMKQTTIYPEIAANSLILQHATIVRKNNKRDISKRLFWGKKLISGEL